MLFIGIDPDVDKSGVAVWDSERKMFVHQTKRRFFDLYIFLINLQHAKNVHVVIEGGHLNSIANFHGRPGQSKRVGETIAKSVGRNHQTGILIGEMCEHLKVPYEFIRPSTKKISSKLFKMMTGKETTDQEIIDASMLVFERKEKK